MHINKVIRVKNTLVIPVLVTIERRTHLFPSRTQKLSSSSPKVLGWRRPGRIGHCQNTKKLESASFPFFMFWRVVINNTKFALQILMSVWVSQLLIAQKDIAETTKLFPIEHKKIGKRKLSFFYVLVCCYKQHKICFANFNVRLGFATFSCSKGHCRNNEIVSD